MIKNGLLPLQVLLCNIKKLQTPCHRKNRTKKLEFTYLELILLILIMKDNFKDEWYLSHGECECMVQD